MYAAQTRALLSTWGRTRTVLYSTHSVPEALELAQHWLIVAGRDLVEIGAGPDDRAATEATILSILEASA